MSIDTPSERPRFSWEVFRGRCRRRLIVGLVLMLVAASYALYAGRHFAQRGSDLTAFDRVFVLPVAGALLPMPPQLGAVRPSNDRELYLATVISDQADVLTGLVVLIARLIPAVTIGGLGIVLLAAGSIEWEIRSETAPRLVA